MVFLVASNDDIINLIAQNPQAEEIVVRVTAVPTIASAPSMRRNLLRGINLGGWDCYPQRLLTNLACLAVELVEVRDRILPHLIQDPADFRMMLKLKNSAWLIRFLGREQYSGANGGVTRAACATLANRLLRVTRRVLVGRADPAWMQLRLPAVVPPINNILNHTPVNFFPAPA